MRASPHSPASFRDVSRPSEPPTSASSTDTTLVLARDSQGTTLYGRGRDIEEIESALSFDRTTGYWTMLGAAAEVRRSDAQCDPRRLAWIARGHAPKDIMLAAGLENRNALDILLYKMMKAGEIEKAGRALYHLPGIHAPERMERTKDRK